MSFQLLEIKTPTGEISALAIYQGEIELHIYSKADSTIVIHQAKPKHRPIAEIRPASTVIEPPGETL